MFRIFSIPIPNDGMIEAELNQFLSSHRIVSVRTQWVMSEAVPYQVFTVEYSGSVNEVQKGLNSLSQGGGSQRVDYQKVLTNAQFVRYCKMREERKKIADEEATKAFVVFTNEQLATIAKMESPTLESLKTVDGVGESRIKNYGIRILKCLEEKEEENKEKSQNDKNIDEDKDVKEELF